MNVQANISNLALVDRDTVLLHVFIF